MARAVVAVRSLHRFGHAEGLMPVDPAATVQPPRPARRLPKALSIDQVQAMLEVPATDTELGLRDRALLELLYGTGARISEAIGLDVDEVAGLLHPRAVGHGGSSPRRGSSAQRSTDPGPAAARQGPQGTDRAAGLVRPGGPGRRTWSGLGRDWPAVAPVRRRCS